MVLDIAGGSLSDMANLQLWERNETDAQKFKTTYIGNEYYTIEAKYSGKLIDVAGGLNIPGTADNIEAII